MGVERRRNGRDRRSVGRLRWRRRRRRIEGRRGGRRRE